MASTCGKPSGPRSRASLQSAAPDWATAAVRAMALHATGGRWDRAARAARIAVRMSGGIAALGGDAAREAHAAVVARAAVIEARERKAGEPRARAPKACARKPHAAAG